MARPWVATHSAGTVINYNKITQLNLKNNIIKICIDSNKNTNYKE
jgi:hypothetical protein